MELKENIFKQFSWLEAAYKTGSSVNPWITSPNDTDYLFITNRETTIKERANLYKYKPIYETWIVRKDKDTDESVFSYLSHFMECIYGKDVGIRQDIFNNLEKYKKVLVNTGKRKNLNFESVKSYKFWYHILTGIYLIENGSYDLSDEQIENVRICHKKNMTPEIFDFIQEKLDQYKKDLESTGEDL